MGDCDAAQAVQLIRALCDQLREMTHQFSGVESRDVTTTGRATAKRLEEAALLRDIAEAQRHIDRLQRRYHLNGDTRGQQGPAAGQSRYANGNAWSYVTGTLTAWPSSDTRSNAAP
jgi:hypothetical protein